MPERQGGVRERGGGEITNILLTYISYIFYYKYTATLLRLLSSYFQQVPCNENESALISKL